MSKQYQVTWPAHPNINNNRSQRDLNIYFSEPEQGVNEETGVLLLIPGFGGNANSNVYKKMRSKFADDNNLVTIQCDYFGQEFMQGSKSVNLNISKEELSGIFTADEIEKVFLKGFDVNAFVEIGSRYSLNVIVKELLEESTGSFNDMGIMQAIDNLTALHYVMKILEDNKLVFNTERIILFGQSQGAYLSYLCNALAPHLFSLLIDNSSWIFPQYLKVSRYLTNQIGKMTLQIEFDYLASRLDYDEQFLNLRSLYRLFENKCKIVCYHGTADNLISHVEKRSFCNEVANCTYYEIGPEEVDGKVFKSTNHGLDADFLQLFSYVMSRAKFGHSRDVKATSVHIETQKNVYEVCYDTGLPVVTVREK